MLVNLFFNSLIVYNARQYIHMQTPPTPSQHVRRRRRSRGKAGVDAKILRERLTATMYSGQKITPNPSRIAQYLHVSIEDVRRMPSQKRFMLSSLIDIENSSLVGTKAAEQRVLSSKISEGKFQDASDMLNAGFEALGQAEEKVPHPNWDDTLSERKESRVLNIDAECKSAGLSQDRADSLKRKLKMIETQIREDPDCGNVEAFVKQQRMKKAQQIRQELLQIDEKTLQPNIEKQQEIQRKLSEEASQAIVGEYRERLENLETVIEDMDENSEKSLRIQETVADILKQQEIKRKLSEEESRANVGQRLENLETAIEDISENSRKSLRAQEIVADDILVVKKMQREAKKQIEEYHGQQMQQLTQAMTTLQRIDYNTTQSGLDIRLNRQTGLSNAFGLTWLAKDFAKIFTSVFFDDVWQLNVSATRPFKQMFGTVVTLIEVLMKNIQKGLMHVWSGIYCFESSPVTCLVLWSLKSLAVVLALYMVWLACENALPTVMPYIKELAMHLVGSLKWAAAKLYTLVDGAIGDILGKAYAHLSTMLSEAAGKVMEFLNEYVVERVSASFQTLLAWIASRLRSMFNPLHTASQKAGELAAAASTAGSSVLSKLNPMNWLGVVENPQFRQWVLDNPEFRNHLVSIEEVEEEETREQVNTKQLMLTF